MQESKNFSCCGDRPQRVGKGLLVTADLKVCCLHSGPSTTGARPSKTGRVRPVADARSCSATSLDDGLNASAYIYESTDLLDTTRDIVDALFDSQRIREDREDITDRSILACRGTEQYENHRD